MTKSDQLLSFNRCFLSRLRRSSRHSWRYHCHGYGRAYHRLRGTSSSKTLQAAAKGRRTAPNVRRCPRRCCRRRRQVRLRQGRLHRSAIRRPLRQLYAHAHCRELRDVIAESRHDVIDRPCRRRWRQAIAQRENGEGFYRMTPALTWVFFVPYKLHTTDFFYNRRDMDQDSRSPLVGLGPIFVFEVVNQSERNGERVENWFLFICLSSLTLWRERSSVSRVSHRGLHGSLVRLCRTVTSHDSFSRHCRSEVE